MVLGLVRGKKHPGIVRDEDKVPKVGDRVQLGEDMVEVVEVAELIPPQGNFGFLHATCRMVADE